MPGGHVIPFLAFCAANLIIYWSTWPINWKLFVAVLIGFVLLGVFHATGQITASSYDLKAGATWTIPWLAGLALISYLGDYGGTGLISFGWSVPVNVIFSAVIYVLAYKYALPTEQGRGVHRRGAPRGTRRGAGDRLRALDRSAGHQLRLPWRAGSGCALSWMT